MSGVKNTEELRHDAPVHLRTMNYIQSQTLENSFIKNNKGHFDLGCGVNHPSSDASGSRGFLPREVLAFADRMQSEDERVAGLNGAPERRGKKDSDWHSMVRQLEKSVGASVQDKIATALVNGKGVSGGTGIARALGMYLEPNALSRGVQDVLADRTHNAGSSYYSRSGVSLLKETLDNGATRATHDLVGSELVKGSNHKAGVRRGGAMGAGIAPDFDTNFDRNGNVSRLGFSASDHKDQISTSDYLGKEKNFYWMPLQHFTKFIQMYYGSNIPMRGTASAEGTSPSSSAKGASSNSVEGPGWAAQSRAMRQAADVGLMSLRRHEGVTKQILEVGDRRVAESGTDAESLARSQRGSPGAAVRSVGGAGHSAAKHDTGRTMEMEARHSPHGELARPPAIRTRVQGRSKIQVRARLDPADFAAFRRPSYLAVAAAASLGQSGHLVQAAAAQLPTWMTSRMPGEAGPGVAMAPKEDRPPSWAVPAWIRPGADDGTTERVMRLMPMRTSPAAPGAASTVRAASTTEADGAWSSFGQDRRNSFASSPDTRAAWTGPAWSVEQVPPAEGAASASFDAMDDAQRQMLDEMTRLASRPSAGVTGFDAGQMPAWLGGWTGSV